MPKQYKLLKDLPSINAGTIFTKGMGDVYNRYYFQENDSGSSLTISWVENNPDWFEPVTEPPYLFTACRKCYMQGLNEMALLISETEKINPFPFLENKKHKLQFQKYFNYFIYPPPKQ